MKIRENPIVIAFYENVFGYLQRDVPPELTLFKNIDRWIEAKEKKILSWEATEENLKLLDRCVNNARSLDDETWTQVRNQFLIAAFKDLSTFRDPKAMGIFERLRTILTLNEGELLLWARTVTKRTDGSAVIVMHVSNLEAFEGMLNTQSGDGFLQEGLMIYR